MNFDKFWNLLTNEFLNFFASPKSEEFVELFILQIYKLQIFITFHNFPAYLTVTSVTSDHWHYPEEKPNGVLEGELIALYFVIFVAVQADSLKQWIEKLQPWTFAVFWPKDAHCTW